MSRAFNFGFDIVTEKGLLPRPVQIKTWNAEERGPLKTHAPLKFFADALCGLSLMRLHPGLQCPVTPKKQPKQDPAFCEKAWRALDPHWELWHRAQDRVRALQGEVRKIDAKLVGDLEHTFHEAMAEACHADGIDLRRLSDWVDAINDLELRMGTPLLYQFGLSLSPAFNEKLHCLLSLLFHLRSVVAVDWNNHVEDPSHEAVKVDSITDYVPRAEYIVNDALLYWQFKKLSRPFTASKNSDVRIEKLFVEPMEHAFWQTSHNACHLIARLPESFITRFSTPDLEEALYHVQMDWLLGSDAGLLFRIREEMYGLQNGYEKVFWPELSGVKSKEAHHLALNFELNEAHLHGSKAA